MPSQQYGIVLLPPEDIWDWLRQLNMTVNADMERPLIVLGDRQKPHATLAHTYVSDPEDIIMPLTPVLQNAHPLEITISSFTVDTIGEHTWSSAVIQDSPPLHELHIDVMDTLQPYESQPSTYREMFSYDKYFPHFTLGVNAIRANIHFTPRQVTIDRVALCEMDPPYSTCGTIINEWKLS